MNFKEYPGVTLSVHNIKKGERVSSCLHCHGKPCDCTKHKIISDEHSRRLVDIKNASKDT